MPTVAESMWLARRERVEQAVKEFVEAARGSVDDSEGVLSARLFGAGLRGQDLRTQVRLALMEKSEKRVTTIVSGGRALDYDAQIVKKLSNPDSHLGFQEDFEVVRRANGYYWVDVRTDFKGQESGPFPTSKAAYAAFHNHVGWEMHDD